MPHPLDGLLLDDDPLLAGIQIDLGPRDNLENRWNPLHQHGARSLQRVAEYEASRDPEADAETRRRAVFHGRNSARYTRDMIKHYERYSEIMKRDGHADLGPGWDWERMWPQSLAAVQSWLIERIERSNIKVKHSTVLTYGTSIKTAVLAWDTGLQSTRESRAAFADNVDAFIQTLRAKYNTSNEKATKVALYAGDAALILQYNYSHVSHGDVAVQMALLILLSFATGARPSTFLPSEGSDFAISWQDFFLRPRRLESGKIVGFDLHIDMRNFKTAMLGSSTGNQAKRVRMFLRTVSRARNLLFDLGTVFIAHAVRSKTMPPGLDTEEKLYSTNLAEITFKHIPPSTPVFRQMKAKGAGLDPTTPLNTKNANPKLNEILFALGMKGGSDEIVGFTSFRRGTATMFTHLFGPDNARLLLGHAADTTVLETSYDLGRETIDILGGMVGEDRDDLDMAGGVAPRWQLRPVEPLVLPKLTVCNMAKNDPELRIMLAAKCVLSRCTLEGSDKWKETPPFCYKDYLSKKDEEEALKQINGSIKKRLNRLRIEYQRQAQAANHDMAANLSWQQKKANAQEVTDLLDTLPESLIEESLTKAKEQFMAEDGKDEEAVVELDEQALFGADECVGDEDLMGEREITELVAQLTRETASGIVPVQIAHIIPSAPAERYEAIADQKKLLLSALIRLSGHHEESVRVVPCLQCQDDPHVPLETKDKRYKPSDLIRHLGGYRLSDATGKTTLGYHAAIQQWKRWAPKTSGRFLCPVCEASYQSSSALMYHCVSNHAGEGGKGIPWGVWEYMLRQGNYETKLGKARDANTSLIRPLLASTDYDEATSAIRHRKRTMAGGISKRTLPYPVKRELVHRGRVSAFLNAQFVSRASFLSDGEVAYDMATRRPARPLS